MLGRRIENPVEEVAHGGRNVLAVRFQREVASRVKMDLGLRIISPECLGSDR